MEDDLPREAKDWIKVRFPAAVVGGLISLAVSATTLWANQGHLVEQAAKDAAEAKAIATSNAEDIKAIQLELAELRPFIKSTSDSLKEIRSDIKRLRK